ncbi:hypothetical protein [Methylobacterium sp. J-090]|uniref:hypothetical protein n=1 Tax=Methylobacterium sp. J-090 TaxID=2836666 RepID=UPI001FB9C093|nr:hypothetical protein [Methylobacterium sp. J-090]MCJ2082435.1 hypothetical protein [Methylobacterium sp. J-090]
MKMRSSSTRASYYLEGRKHLERAIAAFPQVCPLQALVQDVEGAPKDIASKLRPSTTRRYLEDLRVIVSVIVRAARRAGAICEPEPTMMRIEAALLSRRGRPAEPRGASRRIKDPTEVEAGLAFVHLKKLALRDRTMTAAAAALYTLVEPRVGFRPVELCGATVEGTILAIPNAKLGNGQDRWRRLDLKNYPNAVIAAIRILVRLAPAPGNPQAFARWRNGLASSLARASLAAGGRRLALYSFRHVAIATWEKSGFSAEEIAALAGHLSMRTARTHYARAASGWELTERPEPIVVPVRADTALAAPNTLVEPGTDLLASSASADPPLEFEPLPEPDVRPDAVASPSDKTAEWFETYKARIEDMTQRLALDRVRQPRDPPDRDSRDWTNRRS